MSSSQAQNALCPQTWEGVAVGEKNPGQRTGAGDSHALLPPSPNFHPMGRSSILTSISNHSRQPMHPFASPFPTRHTLVALLTPGTRKPRSRIWNASPHTFLLSSSRPGTLGGPFHRRGRGRRRVRFGGDFLFGGTRTHDQTHVAGLLGPFKQDKAPPATALGVASGRPADAVFPFSTALGVAPTQPRSIILPDRGAAQENWRVQARANPRSALWSGRGGGFGASL